jgi:L-threonylcarbamoyladenylate synthase
VITPDEIESSHFYIGPLRVIEQRTTRVLPGTDPENLLTAARVLRDGGVVVLPTDTLYGLTASVYQREAVERVFRIKGRALDRQVPILLATAADLPLLVSDVPRRAWSLIDRFWPGALTLVLPVSKSAPDWIARSGQTVGVRVPAGRACLELLQVLGEPAVGTSANISGQSPAITAREAASQLDGLPDLIIADDSGIKVGAPSTVVEVRDDVSVVHRLGAIGADEIREVAASRVVVRADVPQLAGRR